MIEALTPDTLAAIDSAAARFTGHIHCATPESEVSRRARHARIFRSSPLKPAAIHAFVKACIAHHRANVEVWRIFS